MKVGGGVVLNSRNDKRRVDVDVDLVIDDRNEE
jgi:hypothetical protein